MEIEQLTKAGTCSSACGMLLRASSRILLCTIYREEKTTAS